MKMNMDANNEGLVGGVPNIHELLIPTNIEKGEEFIHNTNELNKQLERQVEQMYGIDYYEIYQKVKAWASEKTEAAITWGQNKSLLPKSKEGMILASKIAVAAGVVAPLGIVTLLPISLILLKRSKTMDSAPATKINIENNYV